MDGDGDPDVVLSTYDPPALTFLLNAETELSNVAQASP
jgi:hypothetical protein